MQRIKIFNQSIEKAENEINRWMEENSPINIVQMFLEENQVILLYEIETESGHRDYEIIETLKVIAENLRDIYTSL